MELTQRQTSLNLRGIEGLQCFHDGNHDQISRCERLEGSEVVLEA